MALKKQQYIVSCLLRLSCAYAFDTFLDEICYIRCKKTWKRCPKHNIIQLLLAMPEVI